MKNAVLACCLLFVFGCGSQSVDSSKEAVSESLLSENPAPCRVQYREESRGWKADDQFEYFSFGEQADGSGCKKRSQGADRFMRGRFSKSGVSR